MPIFTGQAIIIKF